MLTLKQFTGSLVTPTDDALFYDFLLSGQCGIFEGCEVTHLGANQLRVSSGRGVILGRIFTVEEETIQAAVSPGGEVDGRLLIRVDMGNEEKPIEFVTQAETPLPELVQEDINRDGSVYELPLAVYKVTELLISGLKSIASNLVATSSMAVMRTIHTTMSWTEKSTAGGMPYWEQAVTVPDLSALAQVNIALDTDGMNQMSNDGVMALWAENDNGICIIKVLGAAPTAVLTLYLTILEVVLA